MQEFVSSIFACSGGSVEDYHNMIYGKFYTRAAPYLVGMAVGYYLAKRDNMKKKEFKVSVCTVPVYFWIRLNIYIQTHLVTA